MKTVAIAVVCKTPAAGLSKTRLSPPLHPEECAAISSCFIRDLSATIQTLANEGGVTGYALFTPRGSEPALRRLLPALLEVGSAAKSAQAWEIEAGLTYDDHAWRLYDELWAVSSDARPDLSPEDRRAEIDRLIDPLLDPEVSDSDKAELVVGLFRAVLAARVLPLLGS